MPNLHGFDANKYPPMREKKAYTAIEPGTYQAIITKSEMKATKNGNGQYLEFTFEIVSHERHTGRRLWDRLNLVNPTEQTMDIARSRLATICKAIGIDNPPNTEVLHDKPLNIEVEVGEYNGKPTNDIIGYSSVTESTLNNGAVPDSDLPPVGSDEIPF